MQWPGSVARRGAALQDEPSSVLGRLSRLRAPCPGLGAAQGGAPELDPVGTREQAVADGVGDRRFAQALVPERDRELARDDRGAQARPILDHLEQVGGLGVGERLEGKVIEHEDVDPGQAASRRGRRPSRRAVASSVSRRGTRR